MKPKETDEIEMFRRMIVSRAISLEELLMIYKKHKKIKKLSGLVKKHKK
jgi:hypothetical protein